ncbi:hypothetical protein WJX81_007467 [Elliptochloris bilobata]|uniref:Pseudouridine synthase n=1 Tax=Elliptochloris bilobata TaxID=381761 RepID=A0AAW1R3P9_9CHLO
MPQASRARLQAAIREGYVRVNGKPQPKTSYAVRAGDSVLCVLPPPAPLEAAPEAIPLDVVYEDAHLLVVNKQAGLVTDAAHAHLADQFKAHTVERTYQAIVLGRPQRAQGRVETNVGRDLHDRKKMAAFAYMSNRGRHASSGYEVLEGLADGGAALLRWRLRTGRTHQIRVHARHAGHPLLGDAPYGGAAGSAVTVIARGNSERQAAVSRALAALQRPALHAQTLGFDHPATGERLQFTSLLPADFEAALVELRAVTTPDLALAGRAPPASQW